MYRTFTTLGKRMWSKILLSTPFAQHDWNASTARFPHNIDVHHWLQSPKTRTSILGLRLPSPLQENFGENGYL